MLNNSCIISFITSQVDNLTEIKTGFEKELIRQKYLCTVHYNL